MNDQINAVGQPGTASLVPVIPGLAWTEIRTAAVDFAAHGWPVLPGTYQFAEHGGWLGKPGVVGLEPVAALWPMAATTDPELALEWWTRRPYSVLLACGSVVNAVEVPAAHGKRALARLPACERGPVAATPLDSCVFFVRSADEPLRAELACRAHTQLHAEGSWLPLPPTSREGIRYWWRVSPSSVEWALPASAEVQRVLVESLRPPASGAGPGTA